MAVNGAAWGASLGGGPYRIILNVSEDTNAGANYSTVNASGYIIKDGGTAYYSYNLNNSMYWRIDIGGQAWDGYTSYDFRYPNNGAGSTSGGTSGVTSGAIYHNTNGSGSVSVRLQYSGPGPLTSGDTGWVTYTLTDFTRVPTTPSFASVNRNVRSISTTINGVTNYGSGLYYYQDYATSPNGSSWSAYGNQQASTGTSFSLSGLSDSTYYRLRTYAADSEGTSGTSTYDVFIPTVPGVPGPVSVSTPAGRAVTVTTGAASNGGTATGMAYFAQASADNGATWGTAVSMSADGANFKADFSNLTGGATYAFRVYASNEMGSGATSTPVSNVFVPSGGKRYTGTSYVNASIASRYDGTTSQFVGLTTTKKYLVSGQITNAVGNGSSVTYTATNVFTAASSLTAGDVISITGVNPPAYNLTNVRVTSCTGTQFTVASTATGTYVSSNGTAQGWCDLN